MSASIDITPHLPLADRIAGAFRGKLPPQVLFSDIQQAARIGLFDALTKDPEAKIAYLCIRIRGSIKDELRREDWLSRRARKLQESGADPVSIVRFGDIGPETEEFEVLESRADPEEASIRRQETDYRAAEAIRGIASEPLRARDLSRDIAIVHDYFFRHRNMKEVATTHGISEPRVSQIIARCKERMREHLQKCDEAAVADRATRRALAEPESHPPPLPPRPPVAMATEPEPALGRPCARKTLKMIRAEADQIQTQLTMDALSQSGGNMAAAARLLKVSHTTLAWWCRRNRIKNIVLDMRAEEAEVSAALPTTGRATSPKYKQWNRDMSPLPEPSPEATAAPAPRREIADLRAQGLSSRRIASKLGVNVFLVQKALRTPLPLARAVPR